MSDGADLGKIVSLIMENPKLIEEITNLGKGASQEHESFEEHRADIPGTESPEAEGAESASAESAIEPPRPRRSSVKNRSQLLFALKPYVSKERAQAIDSMLSVVEILDAMKGR